VLYTLVYDRIVSSSIDPIGKTRNCPAESEKEASSRAKMIEVDGSQKSGTGTIVRYSVALAALMGESLHLFNARARREKPGLRPQHLNSVQACAEICGGRTEGLSVGCREFTFFPGGRIRGGDYEWNIGTAGSTTMLALSVLPLACFADAPLTARITGGVFQDFAPSPFHMQHVLAPLLQRMGAAMELRVVRAGYVPAGNGVIELRVKPAKRQLRPLSLTEQGSFSEVCGIAFSSNLEERRVSDRMARVCEQRLGKAGLASKIARVYDRAALHAGASLAVWGRSSTDCLLGADRAGALGRSSESIGRFVAETFVADLATGATVDQHLADQLVLFAALADGASRYLVPRQGEHLDSNLWLVELIGGKGRFQGKQVTVEGSGFCR
jgi:RNA 3'-terminal phosphate cyclase (ATP)